MTIFRFSLVLLLSPLAAGCADGAPSEESPKRITEQTAPVYRPSINRGEESIRAEQLLKEHRENPNRFAIANENATFTVEGKIADVPKFTEILGHSSAYYLPLKLRDHDDPEHRMYERIIQRDSGFPEVKSLSVSLVGFSLEKAAALDRNEEIVAACKTLEVQMSGLAFGKCELEAK